MLDVQEMNDGAGTDDLGENGNPGRLSGEAPVSRFHFGHCDPAPKGKKSMCGQ